MIIKELINIFEDEITTLAESVPKGWHSGSDNWCEDRKTSWNMRYFFMSQVSYSFGHDDCVPPLQQHARDIEQRIKEHLDGPIFDVNTLKKHVNKTVDLDEMSFAVNDVLRRVRRQEVGLYQ